MPEFQPKKVIFVPLATGADNFTASDFIHDGAAHVDGLDVSPIVPSGAIAVAFWNVIKNSSAAKFFTFTKNAVDTRNKGGGYITNANTWSYDFFVVACDPDRKYDYTSNLTGTDGSTRRVGLAVVGWFI